MKVATTRAELHIIRHKSIQVVVEGIGLENYFIRNVAALRNFQRNVCLRKIKTLCRHAVFEFLSGRTGRNWIQRSTLKARRQQFIIKVSSGQKSPKVIDRFAFNYLAVDNAGQIADNKHTGSMSFGFFLPASKTDKPSGDITFQNQSVNLIC